MVTTLVSQAAVLLREILTHELPSPCSLEQLEERAHQQIHEIARLAITTRAQQLITVSESQPLLCLCGREMAPQQRRRRELLGLFGLIRLRLRRYRCPACGAWQAPGAQALSLRPRQRLTRRAEEWLCRFGLSWSYAVGARLAAQLLPGLSVSAKTVERATKRCARQVAAGLELQATAALDDPAAVAVTGPAWVQPRRLYVGLDVVLVRARTAKHWVEVQVGSLWSACREIPGRKHPRREILDATVVARAAGWEVLGRQVWREFVQRGGAALEQAEIVVLGDGAAGIRSLWEMHFGAALVILDPWHLWEKLKQRSRQVLGKGKAAREACQAVYGQLRVGAVTAAMGLVAEWSAESDYAQKQRERLLNYLERNREIIQDCEQLRAAGYQVGSGLTEKANDLVVVPRMKNGKMHWSAAGADSVAMLRACLISSPDMEILPM